MYVVVSAAADTEFEISKRPTQAPHRLSVAAPFDVQLDFVPDDATPAMPPPPPGSGISGPSIGAALQQQLGLRLEPANGAAEMIVIDQAERPSDN